MIKLIIAECRGYTFIELLIAIAILGIIVSPLIALFSGSYLTVDNSGNHTIAVNLCRDHIESLKSSGYPSVYDLSAGNDFRPIYENNLPDLPGFQRTTVIQPYNFKYAGISGENDHYTFNILLIEVTVNWSFHEKIYSETVTTLFSSW